MGYYKHWGQGPEDRGPKDLESVLHMHSFYKTEMQLQATCANVLSSNIRQWGLCHCIDYSP